MSGLGRSRFIDGIQEFTIGRYGQESRVIAAVGIAHPLRFAGLTVEAIYVDTLAFSAGISANEQIIILRKKPLA